MQYMTRNDEGLGEGSFDSIHWLFETHIKQDDTGEYNFAVTTGNEDAPSKVELWRDTPNHDTPADKIVILDPHLALDIIRKHVAPGMANFDAALDCLKESA